MLIALASFALPAALLVLLPGPDSLVVMRSLLRGGRRGGAACSVGVLCGVMVWVSAAVLGISALLQASEVGYDVLKTVGAVYLVWVGARTLRDAWRARGSHAVDTSAVETPEVGRGLRSAFASGLLTDVLNPKVGVAFVTFLPGFVPAGQPVGLTSLALGLEFAVLTALYFVALITFSAPISRWMQTPRIRRRLDAVTGLVLVGFGVRLATEHRA